MSKQIIISIGREYGSAGHSIAEKLAERFQIELYDSNLLQKAADKDMVPEGYLRQYDEKPAGSIWLQKFQGIGITPEERLAEMQFQFLRKAADEGKSFVVVGRCAESVLRKNPALVSIFVVGDHQAAVKRIRELYELSEYDAERLIARENSRRKSYHNYFSSGKWGDSRNYDITINSSRLGLEKTVDVLESYIRLRMEEREA